MPKDPDDPNSRTSSDPKREALARSGTLHPHPERVLDPGFAADPFFDPRDGLQAKYEMLRRVRVDGHPAGRAATAFGLSRPTYYEAQHAFDRSGLAGLLPAKKGPKRAHKLSDEVLTFARAQLAAEPVPSATELARRVSEHFGISVHPKSIARALERRGKKTGPTGGSPP